MCRTKRQWFGFKNHSIKAPIIDDWQKKYIDRSVPWISPPSFLVATSVIAAKTHMTHAKVGTMQCVDSDSTLSWDIIFIRNMVCFPKSFVLTIFQFTYPNPRNCWPLTRMPDFCIAMSIDWNLFASDKHIPSFTKNVWHSQNLEYTIWVSLHSEFGSQWFHSHKIMDHCSDKPLGVPSLVKSCVYVCRTHGKLFA